MKMAFFGETSPRQAVRSYLEHHHSEPNHQGLGNRLIESDAATSKRNGEIHCRERLGGVLEHYHRNAA